MIIYEVNLFINEEIVTQFKEWLPAHMTEMLSFAGFQSARSFSLEDEAGDQTTALTIHYEIDSLENLQNYFTKHAPSMREQGITKFGNQFSATRRILTETNLI